MFYSEQAVNTWVMWFPVDLWHGAQGSEVSDHLTLEVDVLVPKAQLAFEAPKFVLNSAIKQICMNACCRDPNNLEGTHRR